MTTELIFCLECGRPWGVLLDRGERPSDEAKYLAQIEMDESLVEMLDRGRHDGEVVNIETAPDVEAERVVWITEATSRFANDYLNADMMPESACWYPIDQFDAPSWLLKGRKVRWAYRLDCCELDLEDFYVKTPELLSQS